MNSLELPVVDVELFGSSNLQSTAFVVDLLGERDVFLYGPFRPYNVPFTHPVDARRIDALHGVVELEGSDVELCGRLDSGVVRCVNSSTSPVELPLLQGATDVALETSGRRRFGIVEGEVRCVPGNPSSPQRTRLRSP